MSRNIETRLEEQINIDFDELQKLPIGSEERELLYRELLSFYDVRNNEMKIYAEKIKNTDASELEQMKFELEKLKFEHEQIVQRETSKSNFWMWIGDHALSIGSGITSGLATLIFAGKLLKFEETGVCTSGMWRIGNFGKLNWFKRK